MTRWLRRSAYLTIAALVLMVWSVLVPTPLPVMLAMTVGQALGTVAFAIYGGAVFLDLQRIRRAARRAVALEAEARAAALAAAPPVERALDAVSLPSDEPKP